MSELSDLEKIEDMYPNLRFWGIEVNNKHYHGDIDGNDVYINLLQPNLDWLKTALHETVHSEYDSCDLSNGNRIKTLRAEKWAVKESNRRFNELFNNNESINN